MSIPITSYHESFKISMARWPVSGKVVRVSLAMRRSRPGGVRRPWAPRAVGQRATQPRPILALRECLAIFCSNSPLSSMYSPILEGKYHQFCELPSKIKLSHYYNTNASIYRFREPPEHTRYRKSCIVTSDELLSWVCINVSFCSTITKNFL